MTKIIVDAIVTEKIDRIWNAWTNPQEIIKWYFATSDWEAPFAKNDLRVNGRFVTRMVAKDKSSSFDFEGKYTKIITNEVIEYVMDDGREVSIKFEKVSQGIKIIEIFDAEKEHPVEMQKQGWQAILNNFKKYVENRAN